MLLIMGFLLCLVPFLWGEGLQSAAVPKIKLDYSARNSFFFFDK